ncbi:ubiquitin-specific protease ubp2 [Tilletia horrida]|nr:ubiquitin-specific protease ubp2 [Tilletia horrida]
MRVIDAPASSGPSLDITSASASSQPQIQSSEDKGQKSDEVLPQYSALPDVDIQWGDGGTPAGLKNIGNTCYLNSVLQYFFTIKEVREQVMQAAAVIRQAQHPWNGSELRVGGRLVTPSEIERSRKFVVHLSSLFDNMITSPAAAVEPERELAYLALVSSRTEEAVLSTQEAEKKALPEVKTETKAETVPPKATEPSDDAMQTDSQPTPETPATRQATEYEPHAPVRASSAEVLVNSTAVEPAATSTATSEPQANAIPEGNSMTKKVEAQAQESLMQLGAQQDVGECLDNVVFQIEVGLRSAGARPEPLSQSQEEATSASVEASSSLNSAIERLFVGISSQRVVPIEPAPDAKPSEPKREIFTLIPIDITHEGCDVYDGLDNFFDDEQIEGSNVRRTVTLQEPPAILQIQAQRVQYDRLQGKAFKALTHLDVGEIISLDRYLELPDGHPNKASHDARRLETAKLRKAESAIARRKNALFAGKASIADTLRLLSNTLHAYAARPGESGMDEADLTAMQGVADSQAGEVQSDIEKLDKEIRTLKTQREGIWKEAAETLYELVAVFMHRGEATHGHYFLNQRRLPQPVAGSAKWLKYNDEQVCNVTVEEVLKDSTGATPYLLIYVRRKPDPAATIDTVRRTIAGLSAPPAAEMTATSTSNPGPEPGTTVPLHPSPDPAHVPAQTAAEGPASKDDMVLDEPSQPPPAESEAEQVAATSAGPAPAAEIKVEKVKAADAAVPAAEQTQAQTQPSSKTEGDAPIPMQTE